MINHTNKMAGMCGDLRGKLVHEWQRQIGNSAWLPFWLRMQAFTVSVDDFIDDAIFDSLKKDREAYYASR